MALTPPPPAPSIADPSTFEERADARMAWQDVNVAEMTALAADLSEKHQAATAAAGTATTKAGEASESAEVAKGAASTATTQASQASESAEVATGAASTASSAASTAIEKAGAAAESAEAAVALVAAIAGGPVVSVNGKPGPTPNLNSEDVGAQPVLKSGENIKTVGGVSLLGGGDIPISNAGSGGAVITGNVVLTAASPGAMTVTPDIPGRYVTLPDATTCGTGAVLFTIYNTGDFDYGIKNASGTKLGWVRARTGGVIGLSEKATAAGTWTLYGVEKAAVTAVLPAPSLSVTPTGNGKLVAVSLDANRTCLVFGYTSVYAVVHDASTGLWGGATYLGASSAFHACLAGTDKVLFVSVSGSALSASVLSCTGTAVTANAATQGSSTGDFGAIIDIIPVGASFVVSTYNATAGKSAVRAITVTGNVTAVGIESALTGNDAAHTMIFASGSVVRTVSYISASAIYATPFTVSGTNLTPGTGASVATDAGTFRAFVNINGNIVCHYSNSSHYASIFKLTGTTEAASSANLGSSPAANPANAADYAQLADGRMVFAWASGNVFYSAILTDTNGVAATAARSSTSIGQVADLVCSMGSIGSAAKFFLSSAGGGIARLLTLDCSGASPTIFSDESVYSHASSYFYLQASIERGGVRRPEILINGSTVRVLGQFSHFDLQITPGDMRVVSKAVQGGYMPAGVHGTTAGDSWFNALNYGTGARFVHVEATA